LAKHRRDTKWLVVELKRDDTSDAVVGQVLRYMGWVRQHLAQLGEEVQGLIIAREGDAALQYAISGVPNLSFQIYEVEFRLRSPPPVGS
jgi:RecB family endonuclease NucS